ncbi:MAG: hypothetical protein FWE99_03910 [Bacteroidales bacterium]|nr:hypothetical protein [Bacteroidales bacterium]
MKNYINTKLQKKMKTKLLSSSLILGIIALFVMTIASCRPMDAPDIEVQGDLPLQLGAKVYYSPSTGFYYEDGVPRKYRTPSGEFIEKTDPRPSDAAHFANSLGPTRPKQVVYFKPHAAMAYGPETMWPAEIEYNAASAMAETRPAIIVQNEVAAKFNSPLVTEVQNFTGGIQAHKGLHAVALPVDYKIIRENLATFNNNGCQFGNMNGFYWTNLGMNLGALTGHLAWQGAIQGVTPQVRIVPYAYVTIVNLSTMLPI